MGDLWTARRGRIAEKAASCDPPSTAIACTADTSTHGGAINQKNMNNVAVSVSSGVAATPVVDVDQVRLDYAEWRHECLQKAQRYWSPA